MKFLRIASCFPGMYDQIFAIVRGIRSQAASVKECGVGGGMGVYLRVAVSLQDTQARPSYGLVLGNIGSPK